MPISVINLRPFDSKLLMELLVLTRQRGFLCPRHINLLLEQVVHAGRATVAAKEETVLNVVDAVQLILLELVLVAAAVMAIVRATL